MLYYKVVVFNMTVFSKFNEYLIKTYKNRAVCISNYERHGSPRVQSIVLELFG